MTEPAQMVRLRGVRKEFDGLAVIPGIDLDIGSGEFVVFVGPSGSGKSTFLRMIAGLDLPTDGDIFIDGRDVTFDEPADRGIAMVFQSYALYPHMDVAGNMSFNLRIAGVSRSQIAARVDEAARILHLRELLSRKPSELSGGQRQRVAIGRAIVRHPKVFLFDEPLSNLDAALRVEMRLEIERLHRSLGTTMVYVTHDQVEAMTLADRIVVLDRGRIQQVGSPVGLYERPVNRFVAEFIGTPRMNILPRRLAVPGAAPDETIGVRPEAMRLVGEKEAAADSSVRLSVTTHLVERLGGVSFAYFTTDTGDSVIVQLDPAQAPAHGSRVGVAFDRRNAHHFDGEGRSMELSAA